MSKKKLVVVESPSKEKYIKKYLGDDYEVKASYGHIVDLPKKELGVDIDKGFKPKYIVTNRKALKGLKEKFRDKDTLILAVDPDREGEAIGWHVAQRLGVIDSKLKIKPGKSLKRIVFSEITKEAVTKAIKNPRDLDLNLINAQQTRRILDRLVGYKLSPLLWRKIRYGLSAGRVQSSALKLIVDREREIEAFTPDEFWQIVAYLNSSKQIEKKYKIILDGDELKQDNTYDIKFNLVKINNKKAKIDNKSQTESILKTILEKKWIISKITEKKLQKRPSPPFKTSTLQQEAARKLGFSAKKTMMVAQKLYEAGFITYIRTDSITLSNDAIKKVRDYIKKEYSEKYLPEKPIFYKTKSKVAQEAHECIRPTNFSNDPKTIALDRDGKRLYDLIFRKTVASQAANAQVFKQIINIDIDKYLFESVGQRIIFDGFLKILNEKLENSITMELKEGQELFLTNLFGVQKFTKPKSRYTEASLIKKLESLGIGRPSTYASIISTLFLRKYVIKEKRYLRPTDVGRVVLRLLEENFPNIVDFKFTANMEDLLDEVANGKRDWEKVLKDFFDPFEKNLKLKEKELTKKDYTVLGDAPKDKKCPECGGKMLIKLSKYGTFYSCANWPDCKGMLAIDAEKRKKIENEVNDSKFFTIYKHAPKTDDGRDYVLKSGRFGKFWAHPDYPKIKDAKPLEYLKEIEEKIYGKAPMAKDGSKMILRHGRFGEFWAHPDYPKVKEVKRINKKEVMAKKKKLGIS